MIAPLLIKFRKDSIVFLFEKYKNIMISYTKNILENFVEKSFVLINLEPRIVLKELCNSLNSEIVKTFLSVLNKAECNSEDVLKRLIACFNENINTLLSCTDLITFIKFYFRSFDRDSDYLFFL